jgi:alpha-L-arabinofuranosidase
VNDAGEVNVSLVNVDLMDSRAVTITLEGAASGYAVENAQVITGEAKDSHNDFGQAEEVSLQALPEASYAICGKKLEVTLPSKSIVMLGLKPL